MIARSACPELLKPEEIAGPVDSEGILGNYILFLLLEKMNDLHWKEFGDKLQAFIEKRDPELVTMERLRRSQKGGQ